MSIYNICVISDGYPADNEVCNEFIENLVNEFVDQGVNCYVISPQSKIVRLIKKQKTLPLKRIRKTVMKNEVTVYSPDCMSFSAKKIGYINTAYLTYYSQLIGIERTFVKLHKQIGFDAIYAHFIFPAGMIADYLGNKYNIPSFFAYGENTTYTIDYFGKKETHRRLKHIAGVISVSSENKRVLIDNKIINGDKISVFPNAINSSLFYPISKIDARNKLGISSDKFIVAFVGRFLDVKGVDRVANAINMLDNSQIYSFFIGVGPMKPQCNNILYEGAVKHDELITYLCAADVFVLPTKAEGCCNAIIEAMACGLPIISSNLPFNDDILDESNSIRISPTNIAEISDAIDLLYQDRELRNRLACGALQTAEKLSITQRANNILEYMNIVISKKA